MTQFKDRSRKIARELYWEQNDRETYECPDCGRSKDEILGKFEVHHKNGEAMDNRPENHVGLCRLCHNLREGKKPSKKQIRHLRSQNESKDDGSTTESSSSTPSVYLAGSMDYESSENQSWRSSVAERGDRGAYRYTGSTPVAINSPTEVSFSHGCGPVQGIAGDDMELIDESDAILAYFEKKEQVGTLTELVYAVTRGKPALVLFDQSFVPDPESPWQEISEGIEIHHAAPTYWFLINFLEGDGWDGLDTDVEMRAVESRREIKSAFQDWNWHRNILKESMGPPGTAKVPRKQGHSHEEAAREYGDDLASPTTENSKSQSQRISTCDSCGDYADKLYSVETPEGEKEYCRSCKSAADVADMIVNQ